MQQYKEQLKDCQIELSEKSEQLESLALEKKDEVAEKGKDIDRLVETIAQIKNEHTNEIKELEKKWKAIVQQKIDSQQAKHDEELNELTKEWQNERKVKKKVVHSRIKIFDLVRFLILCFLIYHSYVGFLRLLFKFFNFVTLFFNIFEFMYSHYFQSAAQPEAVSSEVKSFISFLFFSF